MDQTLGGDRSSRIDYTEDDPRGQNKRTPNEFATARQSVSLVDRPPEDGVTRNHLRMLSLKMERRALLFSPAAFFCVPPDQPELLILCTSATLGLMRAKK